MLFLVFKWLNWNVLVPHVVGLAKLSEKEPKEPWMHLFYKYDLQPLNTYNSPSLNHENTCSPISVDFELPSWEYEALGFASGFHIPTRMKSSHFTEMDEMY